jgi:hypothetical protein
MLRNYKVCLDLTTLITSSEVKIAKINNLQKVKLLSYPLILLTIMSLVAFARITDLLSKGKN